MAVRPPSVPERAARRRALAFARFWYGFIVGDDWLVAAVVVVALAATYLVSRTTGSFRPRWRRCCQRPCGG